MTVAPPFHMNTHTNTQVDIGQLSTSYPIPATVTASIASVIQSCRSFSSSLKEQKVFSQHLLALIVWTVILVFRTAVSGCHCSNDASCSNVDSCQVPENIITLR